MGLSVKAKLLQVFILFCCVSITFYFSSIQFIRYSKNEDTSSLSYHKLIFDSKSPDQYPTYSICIDNLYGDGTLTTDFLSDIMIAFSKTKCMQSVCAYNTKDKIPLRRSLQSARRQCYSVFFERDSMIEDFESLTDILVLNASKLMDQRINLGVYVHHGGQLMRHLLTSHSPESAYFGSWELENLFLINNQSRSGEVAFSIGNVVIFRNREDGIKKCNSSLIDEDQKWREIVVTIVGCIPIYWKASFPISWKKKFLHNCSE